MINLTSPFLLSLTFLFGVIYLLTMTKLFDKHTSTITEAFIPFNVDSKLGKYLKMLGIWFFYLSILHQAWYWIFQ